MPRSRAAEPTEPDSESPTRLFAEIQIPLGRLNWYHVEQVAVLVEDLDVAAADADEQAAARVQRPGRIDDRRVRCQTSPTFDQLPSRENLEQPALPGADEWPSATKKSLFWATDR